jgi:hypothetical protein
VSLCLCGLKYLCIRGKNLWVIGCGHVHEKRVGHGNGHGHVHEKRSGTGTGTLMKRTESSAELRLGGEEFRGCRGLGRGIRGFDDPTRAMDRPLHIGMGMSIIEEE